jgi:hypothetical protein
MRLAGTCAVAHQSDDVKHVGGLPGDHVVCCHRAVSYIRGDQSMIGRRTIVYRSPSRADIPGAADSLEVPVISAGEGHK